MSTAVLDACINRAPEIADGDEVLRDHWTEIIKGLPYPGLDNVHCQAVGERLMISGHVPSYFLKQVVQEALRHHLRPEMRIENRLRVVRASQDWDEVSMCCIS
ncbi:MAG: hypothetical protein KatS3mg113_0624 [Planctomycetaceae bacterium]|nr:MAG: hypothetical protein KatS3mg113_0624 [Planctomycetaceae bacterium]